MTPLIADAVELLFCPGGEPERALRRRIERARDSAALKANRTEHLDARDLRLIASDFANRRALAPADVEQLQDVIRALTALALTAGIFERLEGGDS